MLKHNKKRNIGLLSEFFAKYMAKAAVDFRFEDYNKADTLWKKHFCKKTELAKELRLFNNLLEARLSDRNVAYGLLKKTKRFVKEQDQTKLDKEKTMLLHEINSSLQDPGFFDRVVENYKINASIQILFNSWRNKDSLNEAAIFSNLSHIEEKVVDYLVEAKAPLPPFNEKILNNTQEDVDKLVINVFREKVDEKYSNLLNSDQKSILGLYVFADKNEATNRELQEKLKKIRNTVSAEIEKEISKKEANVPRKKLMEVKDCLKDPYYNIDNLSKNTIGFYLAIAGLKHELESA